MGVYAADGSINVTVVDGTAVVGAYAADGSWNVIESDGTVGGIRHACGALRVTVVDGTTRVGIHAPDGSINVVQEAGRGLHPSGAFYVTVVSGALGNAANVVGNVSNSASGNPFASVRESIVYDAATERTVWAYEIWNGSGRRLCVSYLDHATGILGPQIDVGLVGLVNDGHGQPSLLKDHQGYWHVFGCAHGANMKHASTNSPNDLHNWTARAEITGTQGYPHAVLVGSAIYLFMRNTAVGQLELELRVTSALNNGVATWGSEIEVIQMEGTDGDRVYAGNFIVIGTEIWFIWCVAGSADLERMHVYFAKYVTTTGALKNFAEDVSIASGSLPLSRVTADASFRIYEHTGTDKGADIPVWFTDDSDNPYVFTCVGPLEGPYTVIMIYNIGAGWVVENTTATGILGRYAVFAPYRNTDGSIELYYPELGTWFLDGDINRVIRDTGGSWGTTERILTAVDWPIERPTPSRDGHVNAKLIMTEGSPTEDDVDAGDRRLFIYGANGFIRRPAGIQNLTFPSISGTLSVGDLLTVDEGEWRAYPQAQFTYPVVDFTYQWFADGVEISGATNSTYTLTSSEVGAFITCRVTGTNGDTNLIQTTDAVGPVEESTLAFFPVQNMQLPAIPSFAPQTAQTSNLIDATGEKHAWIGRMWNPERADKSIRRVGFRFGTVTKAGGSALIVSLQDVDTANGPPFQPDGTQDQTVAIANADASFVSNTFYMTGNFSADRPVAFGELVSVVAEYDGGGRLGADAVNFSNFAQSLTNLTGGTSLFTASWAATAHVPNIVLEFTDGTFGTLDGGLPSIPGFLTFNSGSTPDEHALEFTLPASVKIDGAWFHVLAATGCDFEVRLYEGSTALATEVVDFNTVRSNSQQFMFVTFDDEITLLKDVTYRLAVKPTTANGVNLYYFDVLNAAHKQAYNGENWNVTSRTDGGAWAAPTLTRQFFGGLLVSAIQG